jgi:4-hydroxy-tetrahydrodipicolinate synthase
MKKKVRGTITALITPFSADGKLNEIVLRQLIRFQLDAGVEGIVVLGTTGEAPTLTTQEKEKIICIAREELPKQTLLIVGTGSYSTAQTIENTRLAEKLGADMALVVTPYYNKPTQEGLYQHFKALGKATSLPVIIYNIQGRTGQNLHTETLLRLIDNPTIIGVKDGSGHIQQMMDVLEKISLKNPHFSVLSADDGLTLPCIAMGGDGIISVLSNLFPKEIVKLVWEALGGSHDKARQLHYHLLPLFRAAFVETNPIPIKAAMNICGFQVGECRLPLCALTSESEQHLRETLDSHSYLHCIEEHYRLFQKVSNL